MTQQLVTVDQLESAEARKIPFMAPKAVLALNEELRKERHNMALPDHSGHAIFFMPVYHYWYWVKQIPDLGCSDSQISRRAWIKFLNTDAGSKYKLNPREGKRMPTDSTNRIIVR